MGAGEGDRTECDGYSNGEHYGRIRNSEGTQIQNLLQSVQFSEILWAADLELVKAVKTLPGPPKRDVLLVVNTFIGVGETFNVF